MKKNTSIKALWVIVSILLVANIFWGGIFLWKVKERRHHRQERGSFMERRLGLNEEQKIRFKELRNSHFDEIARLQEEMKAKRKVLYNFKDENVDNIDELSTLHGKIERLRFEHFVELNEQLNPDQRERFERVLKKAASFGGPPEKLRKKRH